MILLATNARVDGNIRKFGMNVKGGWRATDRIREYLCLGTVGIWVARVWWKKIRTRIAPNNSGVSILNVELWESLQGFRLLFYWRTSCPNIDLRSLIVRPSFLWILGTRTFTHYGKKNQQNKCIRLLLDRSADCALFADVCILPRLWI